MENLDLISQSKKIRLSVDFVEDIGVDYLSGSFGIGNDSDKGVQIPGLDLNDPVAVSGASQVFIDPVNVRHLEPEPDPAADNELVVPTAPGIPNPNKTTSIHVGSKIVGLVEQYVDQDLSNGVPELPDSTSSSCEFCNKADGLIRQLQQRIQTMEASWADFGYPISPSSSNSNSSEETAKTEADLHDQHCSKRQKTIDSLVKRIEVLQNQWTSIIEKPMPKPASPPPPPPPTFAQTSEGITIFYKTPCTCTICFDKFPTPHLVTAHFRDFHKIYQTPVFCVPECGYAFRNKFKKMEHIRKNHPGLQCPDCYKTLINASSLEMHLKDKHNKP